MTTPSSPTPSPSSPPSSTPTAPTTPRPATTTPPTTPPPPATPPPASTPPPPSFTDWRRFAPEELRNDPTLAQIKGNTWEEAGPNLVKGYVNAQKLVGGSAKLPGPDAKPDEIRAFQDKLGVPR